MNNLPFSTCTLMDKDLDLVLPFYEEVVRLDASSSDHIIISAEYIERLRIFGSNLFVTYLDDKVIAISAIEQFSNSTADNMVKYRLNSEQLLNSIHLTGMLVHPTYRGYGLQRNHLELREHYVKEWTNCSYVVTTVREDNPHSIKNVIRRKYDCRSATLADRSSYTYYNFAKPLRDDISWESVKYNIPQ